MGAPEPAGVPQSSFADNNPPRTRRDGRRTVPHNGGVKGLTSRAEWPVARPRVTRARRHAAPRILLLTSGLGCGHVRAAQAVEDALRRLAPAAVVHRLDFWSLMNPGVAAAIQQKYLELVLEHSDLYARLHRLDERSWRRVIENDIPPPIEVVELIELVTRNGDAGRRSVASVIDWALGPYPSDLIFYPTACAAMPTRSSERAGNNVALLRLALLKWAFLRLQNRMDQQLLEFAPDAVVATQMVPAALVSALKGNSRRWRGLPLIGVLTDFGAHDYWAQPGIDRYCVPHASIHGPPLVADAQADAQRILVTGVPLAAGFENLPDRAQARVAIGLAPDDARPVVLVLGGGLGIGFDDIVQPLVARLRGCHVMVMAGHNGSALERLRRQAFADQNCASDADGDRGGGGAAELSVQGWTDHMEHFLVAADVVVGKSGGLTLAETLACGRPLLVTRTLQGQESFNVQFLERHGIGRLVGNEELIAQVQAWMADPARLRGVQERARAAGRRDGARRVAEEALSRATRGTWLPRAPARSGT